MVSSGTSPVTTTGAGALSVLNPGSQTYIGEVTVINEATFAGFICLNGNAGPWLRLPSGPSSRSFKLHSERLDLYVMRDPGGSNNVSVFADAQEAP